jgi:acyl transferase domain-containing protein
MDVLITQLTAFYKGLEIPFQGQECSVVSDDGLRRACIDSFGFGGANAYVVLDEFRGVELRTDCTTTNGPFVFLAASRKSLERTLRNYRDFLLENPFIEPFRLA